MTRTRLLALQSLLGSLQVVNAGLAAVTKSALVALIVSAALVGLQQFVTSIAHDADPRRRKVKGAPLS